MTKRILSSPGFTFRHYLWACSLSFVLAVLGLGTVGFIQVGAAPFDAFYKAIQLFGLNFDLPQVADEKTLPPTLQIARMLAPFVLIATVIKLMADGIGLSLQRAYNTRNSARPRDLILGFDPFCQEIGRRLAINERRVTWIDRIAGSSSDENQARETAERIGGFLIIGDPSDTRRLLEAKIDRVERVFVALSDDLASFDAAEAARKMLPKEKSVRMFTSDPALPSALSIAAETGFTTGRGIELFNIEADVARSLIMKARWDDLALLLNQERVHVVIAGCGWQGEALLEETLQLCLRAHLKPPLVTVLDLDAEAVRKRIQRRTPALLTGSFGVNEFITPRFLNVDLTQVDFANFDLRESPEQPAVPVTAWVISTENDNLNIRTGLHLHTAIQTRLLDGAPIHIRVRSGHGVNSHSIGADEITMSSIFGSLEDGFNNTSALDVDPDAYSKIIHMGYLNAEAISPGIGDGVNHNRKTEAESLMNWRNISASKKISNRRAYRHAPMKLADLGFDWRRINDNTLPRIITEDRKALHAAHEMLRDEKFLPVNPGRDKTLSAFYSTMKCEHDRWCIDRVLDGWTYNQDRDECRMHHPNLVTWERLGENLSAEGSTRIRAYDATLIRAIIDNEGNKAVGQAHRVKIVSVVIEQECCLRFFQSLSEWYNATEVRVWLPEGDIKFPALADNAIPELLIELEKAISGGILCKITLLFPAPPVQSVSELANRIASLSRGKVSVACAWLWLAGSGNRVRKVELM